MIKNLLTDQSAAEQNVLDNDYHECLEFEKVSFDNLVLENHTFEDCRFISCSFAHISLKEASFISCEFDACSLTLCDMKFATLNGVVFRNCRLIGLNYTECNSFGFSPEYYDCVLDTNMFFENNLSKCAFEGCTLKNTDFINCNLKEASFRKSTFDAVLFEKANLEKTIFLEARDYRIDPFGNKLKGAKFDLPEAQSFLGYLGIKLEQ